MVGYALGMKSSISAMSALALLLVAGPAFAQNHDSHNQGHGQMRHAPPPRHSSYREGQNWHGHRLTQRNGHWGYVQPRNGAQVFISIPL